MTAPKSPPPLSKARRAGDLLFISGQLPRGENGAIIDGDVEAQCRQALSNLQRVLEAEGALVDQVVKTTVWLTDAAHMETFNRVYTEVFSPPYPARSVVVSQLVAPADIEIEAIAWLG